MKFRRAKGFILCWLIIQSATQSTAWSIKTPLSIQQTKLRYMIVETLKMESEKRALLSDELLSYEGKVAEVWYNDNTHQWTIYYTDQVSADDLLQVIARYTSDFSKISGTEWP